MSLYADPAKPRTRPALIRDLFAVPAKPGNHQIENQTTTVLAWLIDNSHAFAVRFVDLFLDGHVAAPGIIGARTQIPLLKPQGPGCVFPDLSVDGSDRSLQLLVEVKVAADLARFTVEGRSYTQEQFYRLAWQALEGGDAMPRAVGTLTRSGGDTAVDLAGFKARDRSWADVRGALTALADEGALDPAVAAVARSFCHALTELIIIEPLGPEELASWLARERLTAVRVARAVQHQFPASTSKPAGGRQFAGARVTLPDVLGAPLHLRIYAAPAGSRQTLPGWPDSIIVGIERDAGGTLESAASARFQEAGFLRVRDIAGDSMHREQWPLRDAHEDSEAVASQIGDRVKQTGLA